MKYLRFTIKDLCFVIIICGLIAGWFLHHQKMVNEKEQLSAQFQKTIKMQQAEIQNANQLSRELTAQELYNLLRREAAEAAK